MNILIVDDEYLIVQGIRKNTDWDRLGVDKVLCAYSVKQAQKIFLEEQVDIMVTDIEMPKENGLELVQWIKEHGYQTIFLMLTGHQDFNYAQQALNMHAFRYILKPVDTIALEDALEKAIESCKAAKESQQAMTHANAWNEKKEYMIHAFWRDLFQKKSTNAEEIRNSIRQLNLPERWMSGRFCFLRIKVQSREEQEEEDRTLFLEQIFREEMVPEAFVRVLAFSNEEYMAICSEAFSSNAEEAYEKCVAILEKIKKEAANCKFTIYVSFGRMLTEACDCYRQTLRYERTIFSVHSIVIPMEAETEVLSGDRLGTELEQLSTGQWTEELLRYRSAFILEKIAGYFQGRGGLFPAKMLLSLYHEILKTIFRALDSLEDTSSEEVIDEFLMKVADCTDVAGATSCVENFMVWAEEVYLIAEQIIKERKESSSFMNQVKQIIREQISSENLSRNTIADALHMNPDYLSHLFHKQSGELLNTYITQERVSAAKIQLLNTNLPLKEIAYQTGFANVSYFHKQFKRFTGLTPNQYRQKK